MATWREWRAWRREFKSLGIRQVKEREARSIWHQEKQQAARWWLREQELLPYVITALATLIVGLVAWLRQLALARPSTKDSAYRSGRSPDWPKMKQSVQSPALLTAGPRKCRNRGSAGSTRDKFILPRRRCAAFVGRGLKVVSPVSCALFLMEAEF